MNGDAFSSFDIGIIVLIVTLACGFLIYMILRLMEIFSSSRDLKKEKDKIDIEILKMERDFVKKAKEKKENSEQTTSELKEAEKTEVNTESEDVINNEDSNVITDKKEKKDDFSDIQDENIVQF